MGIADDRAIGSSGINGWLLILPPHVLIENELNLCSIQRIYSKQKLSNNMVAETTMPAIMVPEPPRVSNWDR
jgi:hypothetical protein